MIVDTSAIIALLLLEPESEGIRSYLVAAYVDDSIHGGVQQPGHQIGGSRAAGAEERVHERNEQDVCRGIERSEGPRTRRAW